MKISKFLTPACACAFAVSVSCGSKEPTASDDSPASQNDTPEVITTDPPKPVPSEVTDDESAEIEALIEQLASPNKPANPESKWPGGYPDDYDHEAQKKVSSAIEELKAYGVRAFERLVAASADKRYCRSYSTSLLRDFSVGESCIQIIGEQVDHVEGRVGYKGMPLYTDAVIYKQPVQWWQKRRGHSLTTLKLEALDWTIDQEKSLFAQSMKSKDGSHPAKSEKELQEKFIAPLEKAKAALQGE